MDYAIEFYSVIKKFGEHTVLNGIDFKINRGKITTILGFSGSGKSTLMKHMLGLLHPTEGRVVILGQELSKMNEFYLREFRQKFGMLFQYAALFDSMTTFENVAFPLREFTTSPESYITKRVQELLSSVGLTADAYQKLPGELSGGMRKRVGLARALALSPEIMLYDEPTTGLDPITTQTVNDLIVETAHHHGDKEMTSIIISHDIRATLKISDFVAFLDRGRIVEHLPVAEFKQSSHPVVKKFLELETEHFK